MRPKIAGVILLVGLIGVLGIYLSKRPAPRPAPPAPAATTAAATQKPHRVNVRTKPPSTNHVFVMKPVPPPASLQTNDPEEYRREMIAAEVDHLQDLEVRDDPQALQDILAQLTNSEREVRWAAVESAIQFGSRDAIPALKAAAAQTTDPEEKKHLLDSADYLALPSWTEYHQQHPNAKLGKATAEDGSQPSIQIPPQE